MKFLILLFVALLSNLFITLSNAYAQSSLAENVDNQSDYKYTLPAVPASFPSKMEEYLFFDNNFNVIQRLRTEDKAKANLLSDEDKKPVDVLIFKASLEDLNKDFAFSQYITEIDKSKISIDEKNIIIPCLSKDKLAIPLLKHKWGKPIAIIKGRKSLSHSTYYLDEFKFNDKILGGLFAKFVDHIPGVDQKAERELFVNDLLFAVQNNVEDKYKLSLMSTPAVVHLQFLGLPYAVVFRSSEVITNSDFVNVKTYPAHGFLGCEECIEKIATKKYPQIHKPEKAVLKWKEEVFIPMLANEMAVSHFIYGVSFEAHTQNILLDIDQNTGELEKIHYRDFADVLLNPLFLYIKNGLPLNISWDRVKLFSIHNQYFSDLGAQIAKDFWYHVSLYTGQTLTSHVKGFQKQKRLISVFLKNYIQSVESITGYRVSLSEESQMILRQLQDEVKKEDFDSGSLSERSPLRNAFASIVKDIFEQIMKNEIQKLEYELKHSLLEKSKQELLFKSFSKAMQKERVVYRDVESFEKFHYKSSKFNWISTSTHSQIYTPSFLNRINKSDYEFLSFRKRIVMIDKSNRSIIGFSIDPETPFDSTLYTESDRVINKNVELIGGRCEYLY